MDCGNPQYIEYIVYMYTVFKKKRIDNQAKGCSSHCSSIAYAGSQASPPRAPPPEVLQQHRGDHTWGRQKTKATLGCHGDVMGKSDMVVYNITLHIYIIYI